MKNISIPCTKLDMQRKQQQLLRDDMVPRDKRGLQRAGEGGERVVPSFLCFVLFSLAFKAKKFFFFRERRGVSLLREFVFVSFLGEKSR